MNLAPLFHSNQSLPLGIFGQDDCLFRLPDHLRKAWWEKAAVGFMNGGVESEGFMQFANAFKAFAEFKRLPLETAHKLDVVIRAPGSANELSTADVLLNLGDEASWIDLNEARIRLEPGEGVWAAPTSRLLPSSTHEKSDLDILFKIVSGPRAV